MSTPRPLLREVHIYVSETDLRTLTAMADSLDLSVDELAVESLRFYYPLALTLKNDEMAIQYGPDVRHAVPYFLPSRPSTGDEDAFRIQPLPPALWQNGKEPSCACVRLVISDTALAQLRKETSDVGQFVLDGMTCYFQLRDSWNSGNRVFLESDGLIVQEIVMNAASLAPAAPGSTTALSCAA